MTENIFIKALDFFLYIAVAESVTECESVMQSVFSKVLVFI